MKTPHETALRQALRQAAPLPAARPAESFWQDFWARAALTHQESAAAARQPAGVGLLRPWAVGALGAVVFAGLVWAWLQSAVTPGRLAQAPTPASTALSKVEEVEVFSEYSSVMIVEDIEHGGTVIWVASSTP